MRGARAPLKDFFLALFLFLFLSTEMRSSVYSENTYNCIRTSKEHLTERRRVAMAPMFQHFLNLCVEKFPESIEHKDTDGNGNFTTAILEKGDYLHPRR